MGIYYYKLWDLMSLKGITQKDISEQAHISTATLTKIRNGETVSLDVLDRIRELLNCDFEDIITAVPKSDSAEIDWRNSSAAMKANGVYRIVLSVYAKENDLTPATIASRTSLALNTVKNFMDGKDLSSRSILKLMRLGAEYNSRVNKMLFHNENNKVYCESPCGRSKHCMGLRTQWNPDTKQYVEYCLYDCQQTRDETGQLFAVGTCPHPKDTKEMAAAVEQYGSHLRGEVKYIPAKNKQSI